MGMRPIVVPGVSSVTLPTVWARALEAVNALGLEAVEVLARDDDRELRRLLIGADFAADEERSGITWMNAQDRPSVPALPEEFALVDRGKATTRPHPCGDEAAKASRPASCGAPCTTGARPRRRGC
jgi:hypothetical protein